MNQPLDAPASDPAGVPELHLDQIGVDRGSGHAHILNNISFSIPQPGVKIGIVGASGGGKTTLLRVINRLSEPNRGQVWWRGKLLTQYSAPLLRQQIMLVPQEPRLLGMTVAQTLTYPLQLQRLPESQIQARIQLWQQRLSIPEDWMSRQELALSVGERQWVSLVRALIAQPQLLLLDEPTSALDSGRIERLLHALKQVNCTLLMVSHQLPVLETLCDRILWLDQGTLRQDRRAQDINWQDIKAALTEPKTLDSDAWNDLG